MTDFRLRLKPLFLIVFFGTFGYEHRTIGIYMEDGKNHLGKYGPKSQSVEVKCSIFHAPCNHITLLLFLFKLTTCTCGGKSTQRLI